MDRVLEYTASFRWEDADLARLVVLVTEVSDEPKLQSRSIQELAAELDGLEAEERKQLAETSRMFLKATESVLPKFDAVLPKFDVLKNFESVLPKLDVMPSLETVIPKLDFDLSSVVSPVSGDMEGIQKIFRDYSKQMDANQDLAASWSKLVGSHKFDTFVGNPPWKEWSAYLADAAVAADRPDVAEAVEATSEIGADEDDADSEEFLAAMTQLWDFFMAALAKAKSPAEQVAIQALATLLVLWLIYYLAKLGIHIVPPDEPVP
jgi:hypothetical protein